MNTPFLLPLAVRVSPPDLTLPADLPLWLLALGAALLASGLRVWHGRAVRRRAGLTPAPLLDGVPDLLLGALAGVCLALLGGELHPLAPDTSLLLALIGGAQGPKMFGRLGLRL